MKKGVLIVITVLLASFAGAQQINYDDHAAVMQRYTSVETDNVHIVRIKNIADQLEGELDGLQTDIGTLRSQVDELNAVKADLRKEDPALALQLEEINTKLALMDKNINEVKQVRYEPVVEEPHYFGLSSMPLLLVLFAILLTSFAVGSAMARVKKKKDEPKKAQPANVETYIERCLDDNESPHDIKHGLVISGWEPTDIEHAFQKVRKKRPDLF